MIIHLYVVVGLGLGLHYSKYSTTDGRVYTRQPKENLHYAGRNKG
jgi:hypothetical protein